MKQLAIYGGDYAISDAAIDTYLSEHPLNTTDLESALERINTEYWIETHYNFYETYSELAEIGLPQIRRIGVCYCQKTAIPDKRDKY